MADGHGLWADVDETGLRPSKVLLLLRKSCHLPHDAYDGCELCNTLFTLLYGVFNGRHLLGRPFTEADAVECISEILRLYGR